MSTTEHPATDRVSLERLIQAFRQETKGLSLWNIEPANFESGRQLLAVPREAAPELSLLLFLLLAAGDFTWSEDGLIFSPVLASLLRKKLHFTREQIGEVIDRLAGASSSPYMWHAPSGSLLRIIEDHLDEDPDARAALRPGLEKLHKRCRDAESYAEWRKNAQRVEAMLADKGSVAAGAEFHWRTREPWVEALREHVANNPDAWQPLLSHLAQAMSSKPTKKWLAEAEKLVAAVGLAEFRLAFAATLRQIGEPGPAPVLHGGGMAAHDNTLINDLHSDLLRGLVWCAAFTSDAGVTAAVAEATDAAFQKIPMIGPRAPKIGNACLWALSQMDSLEAVAEIGRAKQRAKHASIRAQIAKALEAAAKRAGVTPDELEELAIPTCGLTEVGRLSQTLGDFTAEIEVDSRAVLRWRKADGKVQASIPAAVKASHPAEVKELQKTVKEIERLLPAQRFRIEGLYLAQRSWSLADFRTRYLDHPLVGVLARRLIWRFTPPAQSGHVPSPVDAIWHEGQLTNRQGQPLGELPAETRVLLWHPLFAPDDVPGWCDWLDERQIRQPFQQAYRDIYELTAEERLAGVSTERFAGHILRQHQLNALCQQRGWRYSLLGAFDGGDEPTLTLPRWKISVRYQVEPIETADEVSGMGIFMFVISGAVHFLREDRPLALAEAPPIVFSEALRDVELFVSACTVGLDPRWAEGGPQGRFRDYWRAYALGALNAAAETRKTVVARVLPKLPIADRLTVDGAFLVVRGKLHEYRIHLGSGAVLIAGDERLLPVLPKSPALDPALLPFEGDFLLSQILETAFALTADDKLKEPQLAAFLRKS